MKKQLYWTISDPNITYFRNLGQDYMTLWAKPGNKLHAFDLVNKRRMGALANQDGQVTGSRQDKYEGETHARHVDTRLPRCGRTFVEGSWLGPKYFSKGYVFGFRRKVSHEAPNGTQSYAQADLAVPP